MKTRWRSIAAFSTLGLLLAIPTLAYFRTSLEIVPSDSKRIVQEGTFDIICRFTKLISYYEEFTEYDGYSSTDYHITWKLPHIFDPEETLSNKVSIKLLLLYILLLLQNLNVYYLCIHERPLYFETVARRLLAHTTRPQPL